MAYLTGQIVEGQPETARFRFEVQLHLDFALAEAVGDIGHARIVGQFALEVVGNRDQVLGRRRGELDLDRFAAAEQIGREGE